METTIKPDKEDILEFLREKEEELSSFGVKAIGLFGSYARGEATLASDIDFLVEYEPGQKTFDNFMGLLLFLEAYFEQEIELVTRESVSEHTLPYITQELIYAEASD
jgi:predicted nucleotidyltransferase